MDRPDILEIGQDDFKAVLEDYRIAQISWTFFSVANGEFSAESRGIVDKINAARISLPHDYLMNVLIFDAILAICRLSDERNKDLISFRVIQTHLNKKRKDAGLHQHQDIAAAAGEANSEIANLLKQPVFERIRERRSSHLAHRTEDPKEKLAYRDIEIVLDALKSNFQKLAPLFRASSNYPDATIDEHVRQIRRYWDCLITGANVKSRVG